MCVVSKVLERCIFKHFKDFLCPSFDNAQHGFLQVRSTLTQLLAIYLRIGQSLDKGLQSDIVYFDLAKAFDSVSHQRLHLKLSHYKVSGKLLQLFDSYLGGRSQQCLVHGFTSGRSLVPSGVPQSSILGPLLLLVYVNDLPLVIQNRIAVFADNVKCSCVIESLQDCESLQKDLDSLHGWSDNWHLKFNTSKREVLTVTRKRHPFCYDYKLNNNSLKYVTQIKDLGVSILLDLTWDTHINTILAKANRMLAFLQCNSAMSLIKDRRKLLSLTFVRSYIGYASEVWAPSTISSITKIESLQWRATKFILNIHWQEDISYHECLSRCNLLPLTYWHEVKDLIFYFKCHAGRYTLPIADYVKPKGTCLTHHSSDQDVLIPKCRTKLFQFSFCNRIAKLWNTLLVSTTTLSSLNQFKSQVLQRYPAAFRTNYDITNFNTWKSIYCKCSRSRNLLLAGNCCY